MKKILTIVVALMLVLLITSCVPVQRNSSPYIHYYGSTNYKTEINKTYNRKTEWQTDCSGAPENRIPVGKCYRCQEREKFCYTVPAHEKESNCKSEPHKFTFKERFNQRISIFSAISSGEGSRPCSWTRYLDVRISLFIVSIICTGIRIVLAWSAIALVMACLIHHVAYVLNL